MTKYLSNSCIKVAVLLEYFDDEAHRDTWYTAECPIGSPPTLQWPWQHHPHHTVYLQQLLQWHTRPTLFLLIPCLLSPAHIPIYLNQYRNHTNHNKSRDAQTGHAFKRK